jgi:hypothetical protein
MKPDDPIAQVTNRHIRIWVSVGSYMELSGVELMRAVGGERKQSTSPALCFFSFRLPLPLGHRRLLNHCGQ